MVTRFEIAREIIQQRKIAQAEERARRAEERMEEVANRLSEMQKNPFQVRANLDINWL